MLAATNISKHFGGVAALSAVDLGIELGMARGLVGENGAGKTTLARILCGMIAADEGSISLDGKAVSIGDPRRAAALGIALIPQELELVAFMSVAENIYLGNEPTRWAGIEVDWGALNTQCERLLKDLAIDLEPRAIVAELSVSQQQLVVIARALAKNVKILIMDEPTARLGEAEVDRLLSYVEELKRRGMAIIYISHHLEEIFRVCDRLTILRDGRVVGDCAVADTTVEDVIRLMVARKVEIERKAKAHDLGPEILRVEGISRKGKLDSASFTLRRGEILGIAGLVGAGRTELVRAILGVDPRDAGAIFIDGKEVRIRSMEDSIRHGLYLVPEERRQQGLVLGMSVLENVTLPHLRRFTRALASLDSGAERRHVAGVIDRLRLKTSSMAAPASSLSGGNQQKVVLAKWLDEHARVYFLDEPTRGIDVATKAEIHELIQELAESGAGVIVVSSELPEILTLSDRVIVMREGAISAILEGSGIAPDNIMRNAIPVAA